MGDLLTISEASKRFRIPKDRLYKLVKEGKVTPVGIGKPIRLSSRSLLGATGGGMSSSVRSHAPLGLQETPAILDSIGSDLERLRRTFYAETGQFRELGIMNVLQPRRLSGSTIGAIQEALHEANGEVDLMGVALRGFLFKDGLFHDAILNGLKEERITIRALLLHPTCTAAKARAAAEGDEELRRLFQSARNDRQINEALYNTDLFRNICRSIEIAHGLWQEFGNRVQVKIADFHPTVWMTSTRDVMFAEMYHLGRSDLDIPGKMIAGCVGEQVPILAVAPSSNLYTLLEASFDHIWSTLNPFVRIWTLAEAAAELRGILRHS